MRPGASIPKNKVELQTKGTRSAIRRLRKQSGRERQFVSCENHKISKQIVNTDFAVFALEDYNRIGAGSGMGHGLRTRQAQCSHYHLKEFLRYKAEDLGKRIVLVDPTLTSQQCSSCGWIDRSSRTGGHLHCVRCGIQYEVDLNASMNIARLVDTPTNLFVGF
jgi:putative transposase